MKIKKDFFERDADTVAKELLGKILIRKLDNKKFKSRIVETEAYFGEEDPSSRASKGKNKISEMMWESPGKIMIYNVHKYKMFNIVVGLYGKPSAVLIRALEPLNFKARLSGPGLLTKFLKIDNSFHGKNIFDLSMLSLDEPKDNNFEIGSSFRIGVKKDLESKHRFYIIGNKFVSRYKNE